MSWRRSERLLERQRLEQRTRFDLEMLREIGYCHGIENYSRHLTGRAAGEPPPTLLDYLPSDYLLVVDEMSSDDPAGSWDVPRGPIPQGDLGRLRIPSSQRPGQSPLDLRRVRGAERAEIVDFRDSGPLGVEPGPGRGGGAGGETDGASGSGDLRPTGERADR